MSSNSNNLPLADSFLISQGQERRKSSAQQRKAQEDMHNFNYAKLKYPDGPRDATAGNADDDNDESRGSEEIVGAGVDNTVVEDGHMEEQKGVPIMKMKSMGSGTIIASSPITSYDDEEANNASSSNNDDDANGNDSANMNDQYDRLFQEDYQLEKNTTYDEIMSKIEKKGQSNNNDDIQDEETVEPMLTTSTTDPQQQQQQDDSFAGMLDSILNDTVEEEKDGDVMIDAVVERAEAREHDESVNEEEAEDALSLQQGVVVIDEELAVPPTGVKDPTSSSTDIHMTAPPTPSDGSPSQSSTTLSSEDEQFLAQQQRKKQCRYLLIATIFLIGAIVLASSLGVGIDRGLNHINKSTIFVLMPTQSPTDTPSISFAPTGSQSPSASPTHSNEPSWAPSVSGEPSGIPSEVPSVSIRPSVSLEPTEYPSSEPSITPSEYPSFVPSSSPTATPSVSPSWAPTSFPSSSPTDYPSAFPSWSPTSFPSVSPSAAPTISTMPTASPSISPSAYPTASPSNPPSISSSPTISTQPTFSTMPSSAPSVEVEPLRTMLKLASPSSTSVLYRSTSNHFRALNWLYYDMKNYETYSDDEKVQLWTLGVFYYETIGHTWYDSTNWMRDRVRGNNITVCDWYGLTCDTDGWVTRIELESNRVQRDIPSELQLLTNLQYLGLSYNSLGKLPVWLFDMPNLQVIDLDGNGIQYIPDNISKKNIVKELYLAENEIWELPSSLGMLRKLEVLWLWNNELEGTLPEFMGGFRNLVELDLEDNYLSGDLWPISQLTNIEIFYAFDNMLGGEKTSSPYANSTTADGSLVMSPILQASNLKILDISTNYYFGSLPSSFSSTMTRLEELYLEDLELTGEITPDVFSLSKLEKIYLGMNYFSSTLPVEVGNAQNLKFLRAQHNYRERETNGRLISKGVIGTLPTTIGNLRRLEDIRLENNYISGALPDFSKLSFLARFQIDLNVIRGQLPASIEDLDYLKTFTVFGNYIDGPLPNELRNSFNMSTLNLHDNAFTGTIPTEWGDMKQLSTLDLSHNQLTGEVPTEYGNLVNLEKFYVEWNRLYGFMPEEVCMLTDTDYGMLDKLGANCDTRRKNTRRPTRSPVEELVRRKERSLQEVITVPIVQPTIPPTRKPTSTPTLRPTMKPSQSPTTAAPSMSPTREYFWVCECCSYCEIDPEIHPTFKPTKQPTPEPTVSMQPSPTRGADKEEGPSGNWWGNN